MTMVKKTVGNPKRKPTGAAARGAGPSRPKGATNKVTRELKGMILKAFSDAGGVACLVRCAKDPKTAPSFLTLVGKVLPLQVTGADGRTLAQELAGLNAKRDAVDCRPAHPDRAAGQRGGRACRPGWRRRPADPIRPMGCRPWARCANLRQC
ncbi:MAG: hypothetical protein Q8M01_06355 [Rubrivivax sp.]|nr:hypothetical protein [Rubrivivax sp.]